VKDRQPEGRRHLISGDAGSPATAASRAWPRESGGHAQSERQSNQKKIETANAGQDSALRPQRSPAHAVVVCTDQAAALRLGAHRPAPMMPVFGRLSRGGLSCERQFPAMFESILQIVGDIGRRVGAVAKV